MNANNDNKISQELSAYLDGELNQADSAKVERALSENPELARQLERLEATREMLRGLPRVAVPEGFATRVMAAAQKSKHTRSRRRFSTWHWVSAVAAAAIVAVAVGYPLMVQQTRKTNVTKAVRGGEVKKLDEIARNLKSESELDSTLRRDKMLRPESTAHARVVDGKQLSAVSKPSEKRVLELAAASRHSNNEEIWTDNIEAEQKNVEKVLVSNGLRIVPEGRGVAKSKQMMNCDSGEIYNSAIRCTAGSQVKEVKYLVYAAPPQVSEISKELREKVRVRQVVSQLPENLYEGAISANAYSRRATPAIKLTPATVRENEKPQSDKSKSAKFQYPAAMVITLRYRPHVKFNAMQADAITNLERQNRLPLSLGRCGTGVAVSAEVSGEEKSATSQPVKPATTIPISRPPAD